MATSLCMYLLHTVSFTSQHMLWNPSHISYLLCYLFFMLTPWVNYCCLTLFASDYVHYKWMDEWMYTWSTKVWGTVPSMTNVAQPPLGKASGEWGLVGRTHTHGIGSPMGNQALIVPRPLWDLLFAKTPSPWLDAANVYCVSLKWLPKIYAEPSKDQCNQLNHFSLYICKYPSSFM